MQPFTVPIYAIIVMFWDIIAWHASSLRMCYSTLQSTHGLSNSAESRRESLQDGGDHYHLQSTVHPDDTTQIYQVNDVDSQPDLTTVNQWVEDQQRLASETIESEESDCADESKPLLAATYTGATTSPRPNHPDGSSQIKDVFSSERTSPQYVDKLLTRNFMQQQQQPPQSPGPHQTYVELQICGTKTQNSPPNPETSTSFAEASGQSLPSASSPYISPMLVNQDAKRLSRPLGLVSSEDQPLEEFGPLVSASDQIGLKDGYVQSSIQPPVNPYIKGYMPHSPAAVESAHDHSAVKAVGSQVRTTEPDTREAPDSPPAPMPAWTPPSLLGINSRNLSDGQQ